MEQSHRPIKQGLIKACFFQFSLLIKYSIQLHVYVGQIEHGVRVFMQDNIFDTQMKSVIHKRSPHELFF